MRYLRAHAAELGIDPAKIDSVPTGIDPTHFSPHDKAAARRALNLPEATPLVGIVATLRSWKGHRYLVDALPKLRRADVRLVIVGDGPQRAELERKFSGLNAHFVGYRTGADLAAA